MCAIAGMIGLEADRAVTDLMMKTMLRRGPDGRGIYHDGPCTLLHTRLAVIDLEGGRQPMELAWGEESYTITYNGEIYNTEEVRRELLSLGHQFLGHSDTEVVLHGYAQWREKLLPKLNGIFAFGVWESRNRRLFIARDRMGVKPLFYKLHGGGLIFSSEIKTILAYPTVRAELDADGAAQILLLGPGRTPGSGVFRGIYELEPGCSAVYHDGKLLSNRYWKLKDREHTDDFSQTVERVRELVLDTIHRQTVSDVPIGTFLSGGLDSSLITAVCSNYYAQCNKMIDTFSLDYKNNDRYFVPGKFQPNSDTEFIGIMQNRVKARHHWTVLDSQDLIDNLEAATRARDLPGMADVDFSLLSFCGEIKKHVKVALSGECADEIFGGYPWYRDPTVRAADGFPWAQNSKQRASYLHPWISSGLDPEEFIHERYEETIRQSDVLPGASQEERRVKQMVNLNHRWFMQTLLDRKDRMSMYHGLEVRVPFCDYRIAEYLYGVPWKFKDHNNAEKGLLRTAMEGILPNEILWRKKSPYPKTYDPGYLRIVSERLKILLKDETAPIFQLVRREALDGLLTAEYEWPWYGQLMKVPQTMAFMLQIDYWLREYEVSLV